MSLEWNDWERGYYHATNQLIGKLVALRKEIESVKAPLQKIILDLIDEKNSLCRELDLLRADRVAEQDRAAQLEAADKEIESWKGVAKQFGNDADTLRTHLSFAKDELNRLRGVLEAMENQEPVKIQHRVPFANSNGELVGYSVWIDGRGFDHWPHRSLYLAPGAQPAPTELVGARKVTRDFRWDAAMQCHVPTLKVEFEPVHIDEPSDAKGWQDQDRIAAMLEAAPESKL